MSGATALVARPESTQAVPDLGPSVVVVDDDLSAILLMRRLLAQIGYRNVRCVSNPAEAVEACESHPPALILLDVWMPGIDGLGLLERLRAPGSSAAGVPVMVLSADADPAVRERALRLGASAFVSKPYTPAEIAERIRRLLGGAER